MNSFQICFHLKRELEDWQRKLAVRLFQWRIKGTAVVFEKAYSRLIGTSHVEIEFRASRLS